MTWLMTSESTYKKSQLYWIIKIISIKVCGHGGLGGLAEGDGGGGGGLRDA